MAGIYHTRSRTRWLSIVLTPAARPSLFFVSPARSRV